MHHPAIGQGKDRIMPGALDTAIEEFTLLQRPTGMRTNRPNRLNLMALAIEQDRLAGNVDPARLALTQFADLQGRRPTMWLGRLFVILDPDLFGISEMSAQIGAGQ